VCNPPYIPTASLKSLSSEIIDHEPRIALDGGPYGITIFRRLIAGSMSLLKPNGMLFFEIGERQEKLAARLIEKNGGYEDIRYFDAEGIIRALSANKRAVLL
jgi:release factor glutamine methyltransferase